MRRYKEPVEDAVALVIGAPVFTIVAASTAAVMAVGFVVIETVDRIRHR